MVGNDYEDDETFLTPEEREELEEPQPAAAPITFRSQDFDVKGLVNRLESKDILVPRIRMASEDQSVCSLSPFQRGFVWNKKQMDLFIESLLLEYPIPGLFLVQQTDRRLLVLDGQQRLETLRRFYSGLNGDKKYRLKLTGSKFDGFSYDELPQQFRRIIDNTYITTTVIVLDNRPESNNAVYDVFKRLNSGGTQLTPHEIRMALYNGELMNLIDRSNIRASWRELYGSTQLNRRFRDHELVLRIVALYLEEKSYTKPLGGFLNNFAEKYRQGNRPELQTALNLFDRTADIIAASGVSHPFFMTDRKLLNAARAESIMIGCMHALHDGNMLDASSIHQLLDRLNRNQEYTDSVTSATSDEAQVHKRISLVREALI
jgi:hypothetical protein